MPLTKLTPRNQLRAFYEDVGRLNSGGQMLHSIGQHVELLIKRVDALEASAIEARSVETPQEVPSKGRERGGEAETPNPDNPDHQSDRRRG